MHEETQKIWYIYKITNIENNKVYIGQTKNPKQRWYKHKNDAAQEKPTLIVTKAIKKYGNQAFEFEIIDFAHSYWQADCLEQGWIIRYDSLVSNRKGYNVLLGGITCPKSEEWKQHLSQLFTGRKCEWSKRENLSKENIESKIQQMIGNKYAEGRAPNQTSFKKGHHLNAGKPRKCGPKSQHWKDKMSEINAHKHYLLASWKWFQKDQSKPYNSGNLNNDQIIKVKWLLQYSTMKQTEIAEQFTVKPSVIADIKRGKSGIGTKKKWQRH